MKHPLSIKREEISGYDSGARLEFLSAMTRTWTTFIFPVICLSLVAIERTSSRPMDSDHPFPSSQRSERNHLIMDDGNQGTTILDPYDPAGLLQVKDSYVRRKRQSGPEDVLVCIRFSNLIVLSTTPPLYSSLNSLQIFAWMMYESNRLN